MSEHLFTAKWQQDVFTQISTNLPNDQVVFVSDFAQNYRCVSQDEIKSAHWAVQQVTVHPIVCFYNCIHEDPNASHITQEALVFINLDMKRDHHAVRKFESIAVNHLREKKGSGIHKDHRIH